MATIFGIAVSIGAAYAAAKFENIMDAMQLVFGFVNAPLFATFLLGMFWKRTTGSGAFYGLVLGTATSALHHGLTSSLGQTTWLKGQWLADWLHIQPLQTYGSDMAKNFWMAIFAWTACFVLTIVISVVTRQKKTDEELKGLVYSLTPHLAVGEESLHWYEKPLVLAGFVLIVTVILNIIFR